MSAPVGLRPRSDLPQRVGAGLVLMALALAAVWAGFYWFMGFWLIAAVLVNAEWQSLVGGARGVWRIAAGAIALAAAAYLAINGYASSSIVFLFLGAAATSLFDLRTPWPAGGVPYAGAMLVSLCVLRESAAFGERAILWLFALVWGVDIMAYFGGRLIGGPKLLPSVSPNKTWSGFCVGVFCGAALSSLIAPEGGAKITLFGLGLVGGAIAQGGDLFESALKRRFGVKDSSHLIPGHGGLMDRLDGFIAAAIFAAILGAAHKGAAQAAEGLLLW
jgi:phosphatidate cytidylyltransferase